MNLKVLLPFRVFIEANNVKEIIMETSSGSYGLLPMRLDCVAALVPGIFTYKTESDGVKYIAVDEGVLVKAGQQVLVSVHNAIAGADLSKLHETVEKEIKNLGEKETNARSSMVKLENGLIRSLQKFLKE